MGNLEGTCSGVDLAASRYRGDLLLQNVAVLHAGREAQCAIPRAKRVVDRLVALGRHRGLMLALLLPQPHLVLGILDRLP